jgi:hypothetical protein
MQLSKQPGEFLTRHVSREWGDLSDEDRKENDYSLEHGFRLRPVRFRKAPVHVDRVRARRTDSLTAGTQYHCGEQGLTLRY